MRYVLIYAHGEDVTPLFWSDDKDEAFEVAVTLAQVEDRAIVVGERCADGGCISGIVFPEHPADYIERKELLNGSD